MGAWSLYFLAKLGAQLAHQASLHWWPNLALAIALALPLPSRRWRIARHVLAIIPAVYLLVIDFSPAGTVRWTSIVSLFSAFRADYLLELAGRLPLLRVALALGALIAIWITLRARLRFATVVIAGLLVGALMPAPVSTMATDRGPLPVLGLTLGEQPESALDAFYDGERGRRVTPSRAGPASFDIVLLSVCSFSSDDLDAAHLQATPVLSSFDLVFRDFNSAATYSGPAVIRLLHATCGQQRHRELYNSTPPRECLLFPALEEAGYSTRVLLNHDGRFDDFADQLHRYGGLSSEPAPDTGASIALTAFDGSPVRSDLDVLSRWLKGREHEAGPVALLYNTITLHDGNSGAWLPPGGSVRNYPVRLERLLSDLDRFLQQLEAAGRPTVVVLIPEHGAALRGDASQVSGLRELPTRAITRVPAAVKLIGFPGMRPAGAGPRPGPVEVDRPSSYLALSTLVAGLLQAGPDGINPAQLRQLADALPATSWVAENEGTVLVGAREGDWIRTAQGRWSPVSEGLR